jgi:hypoxanthine phosphoribosyltransferase
MNESIEHEVLTWDLFGEASRSLSKALLDDGFVPDLVVSIARGGLFTAGALAYALGVKRLQVVNVEFYTGQDERLAEPVMLPPLPRPSDFVGAKVLIADDVTDTGRTLAMVKEFCIAVAGEVRTAVVFEKSHTIVRSDYVWKYTDLWVDFPWSSQGAVLIES